MSMRTFLPFPHLPAEIRAEIWEMTVEPRTIELRCSHSRGPYNKVNDRYSLTPAPAALHTCQEARHHLQKFYQQVYLDQVTHAGPSLDSERRYVWLNWDSDMISIGTSLLECFEASAPMISRLKLERDNGDEFWNRWEHQILLKFASVTEMHVVCIGTAMGNWHGASEDLCWPCEPQNVLMIEGSEMMRLTELEDKCDREYEELYLKEDPNSRTKFKNGMPYEPEDFPAS